ncbi:hypothetical protein ACIRFH_33830 [Streptomyces sp. NPDC093586]|uniref:hypothetical protein n=1 Tax=Streptomyces sp. NPDC093586 TaxID=3366042 RepID=UPI0037F14114
MPTGDAQDLERGVVQALPQAQAQYLLLGAPQRRERLHGGGQAPAAVQAARDLVRVVGHGRLASETGGMGGCGPVAEVAP